MKGHVSIEYKICPVTGKKFESNAILLDKRLKDSIERTTVTGYQVCPEVQEKIDEGFIPLVEIDSEKFEIVNGELTPATAHRTGNIAYVKRAVWEQMLGRTVNESFNYIDGDIIQHLNSLQPTKE